MAVIKRIGPGSAFKMGLVVYGVLGSILGVFCSVVALAGVPLAQQMHRPFDGALVGLFAVILCPILYGIIGGVVTAVGALIYNLASRWVGGLEAEIG